MNADVSFSLRVRDISRDAFSWGTEIPVIRQNELYSGTVQLLNVPVEQRFRLALRVYDFDGRGSGRIAMRIFKLGSNTPLVETEIGLDQSYVVDEVPPQVTFVNLVAAFPQLSGAGGVRIELTPLTNPMRYWAFVSITNQETQQVTVVTPQ
jgi:hypothetical protein